jgi:hypothetical protein
MDILKKKRALRRHHYKRLKVKRKRYWNGNMNALSPKHAGMVVSTPKICSQHCCGNPRKWWKERKLQEKRENDRAILELDEMSV